MFVHLLGFTYKTKLFKNSNRLVEQIRTTDNIFSSISSFGNVLRHHKLLPVVPHEFA